MENKLAEKTDDGKRYRYTVEELLGLPLVNKTGFSGSLGK